MRRSGRVEYLYMELDEELILKITAQHFSQLSNQVKKCSQEEDKGTSIVGFSDLVAKKHLKISFL